MIQTININDLPYGGDVRPNDVFPVSRIDGITYKASPFSNESVLFAGENLTIGDAVYLSTDGYVYKAIATNAMMANVLGIISKNSLQSQEVFYVSSGYATTLQQLITGEKYWLSETIAGMYQSFPPVLTGSYSVSIGIGYNIDTLIVQLGTPVLNT